MRHAESVAVRLARHGADTCRRHALGSQSTHWAEAPVSTHEAAVSKVKRLKKELKAERSESQRLRLRLSEALRELEGWRAFAEVERAMPANRDIASVVSALRDPDEGT